MTEQTSINMELDGRRGEMFTSRHPDILNSDELKDQKWFTIREVMRLTQLNGIWVRTQVKDGRWKVKKDEKGRWIVHRSSLITKLTELHNKDERKRLGIKSQYKDPPPRIRSCRIIRKVVKVDPKLTKSERKLFLDSLDRYEEHFQVLYKERMKKINSKKS